MTSFVHAQDLPIRQRAALALRRLARSCGLARRQAEQRSCNPALHDARITAELSRAMNGIAVEDRRRYRL